ncbi:cytochrome P450 [Pseudohaliea rubra]|uniref:Putative cytochrome P450 hydroxylase n=1 Tax=Pseudohaliea rubra DSM 19751 TaxID=1265313 RepID=A0A095VU29_9GAMM|nr:cytochrome P450 [Pseudohaliea rubra]KGE04962.1 putative cytochrome P450 hydroxylase [Pseudohaliea rubra DSM 19751]
MATGKAPAAQDVHYDPRDQVTINDPIPVLRQLQDQAPVYWCEALRGWVITRYDDVKAVLRNEDFSADRITPFFEAQPPERQAPIQQLIRYLNTWVAFKDPPEHTRLRKLMKTVFTPEAVAGQRGVVEKSVQRLLGRLETLQEFDFISEFAFPLPAMVILDLLGLPEEDMDDLKSWSNKMQLFIGSATTSPQKYDLAEEGAIAMAAYFREAIREREQHPGNDLITHLLALREVDDALTEDEVIGTSMLFLFGGHETTTNLIGNGVRVLLTHPAEKERLMTEPALVDSAIEEILRYDGPTGASVRLVKHSHSMHGVHLEAGERVFVMINAANRDPRAWEEPDRFDITRSPNLHLTFNYGPHFCMGAPLARLEGQVAIGEVLRRLPGLTLAAEEYDYMDTMIMRGVRSMPVRNTP